MGEKVQGETFYCTSCDLLINPPGQSNHALAKGSRKVDSKKFLTSPVELNIVKRYLLQNELTSYSDVDEVLDYCNNRLPFCSFCMEMVTKIYDFESEIDRIKGLIDSMVSCLKTKIQIALDNVSYREVDENVIKLRSFMVGHKSWRDKLPEPFSVPEQIISESKPLVNTPHEANDATLLKDIRSSLRKIQLKTGTAVSPSKVEKLAKQNEASLTILLPAVEEVPSTSFLTSNNSLIDPNSEFPQSFLKIEQAENVDLKVEPDHSLTVSLSTDKLTRRKSARTRSSVRTMYPEYVLSDGIASDDDFHDINPDDDNQDVTWQDDGMEFEGDELNDEDEDEEVEFCVKAFPKTDNEDGNEISTLIETNNTRLQKEQSQVKHGFKKSIVTELEPKKFRFEGVIFTLNDDGKYVCSQCNKVLKTRGGTVLHIKQLHMDNDIKIEKSPKPRKNNQMPKYKRRKTDRRQRTVKVLGPGQYEFEGLTFSKTEDGKFKCGVCPNILKTRDSALVHLKQRHLGEGLGTFLCHLCGKSFERDVYLKLHEINHTNPKSHHCDICGKAFTQYANLYNHKKIHKGELNFHCEVESCGKRFLTRKQLTTHMRRHTGERPFECELCPKKFVRSSELTIHLRSHSEERPFACHLCESKFFIRGRLGRHLKNVHKLTMTSDRNPPLPMVTHEVIIETEPNTNTTTITVDASQFVQQNQFITFNDLY